MFLKEKLPYEFPYLTTEALKSFNRMVWEEAINCVFAHMRKKVMIKAGPYLTIIPRKEKIETKIVGLPHLAHVHFGTGEPGLTAINRDYVAAPSIVIGDTSLEQGRYISVTPVEETDDSITLNIKAFTNPAKAVKLLVYSEEIGTMPLHGHREDFKKARN